MLTSLIAVLCLPFVWSAPMADEMEKENEPTLCDASVVQVRHGLFSLHCLLTFFFFFFFQRTTALGVYPSKSWCALLLLVL